MKTILLALLLPVLTVLVGRNTSFFNRLDFLNADHDITWDEIDQDLWP
jgi:hypothetical protein